MAVVISVILVMFIMLAAVTLPLSADLSSSIRLGKVADERQLAESVMNELYSQAAKSSDLSLNFRMVGRVDPSLTRSVDDAGDTAGWAKYVPVTGEFKACGSITELCFFYSPQLTSGSPFVTVEVTTRSACRANGTSCVFRRFQQSWRRRGFVDYVIFTDMETLQPELYGGPPNPASAGDLGLRVVRAGGGPAIFVSTEWAEKHCGDRFVDNGGLAATWPADLVGDSRGAGLNDISRRQTNAASAPLLRYLWPHRVGNVPSGGQDDFSLTVQPTDRRHENCFEIAYTGSSVGDQVNGPIHTNDYWFWYCGNPEFNDIVESTGDPNTLLPTIGRVFKLTTNAGCTGGLPKTSNPLNLVKAQIGDFLKLPEKLTTYATLATKILSPTIGNKVTVDLLPCVIPCTRQMRVSLDGGVTTEVMDVPNRGAVYVPAAVAPNPRNVLEIKGEGADATFVSENDLRVVGNITQPTAEGVTLGFVAGGSITIDQEPKIAGVRADRTVTGAFLSLAGMSVNGWNDVVDAADATHPTLHLTGAIIAKYRPVFGTYNSAGDLQTGMHKDIQYPKNLAGTEKLPPTPPYFVQPVNAVWVRLDFSETPLLSATPGLTKAPTSPPGTAAVAGSCSVTKPTGNPSPYMPSCLVDIP